MMIHAECAEFGSLVPCSKCGMILVLLNHVASAERLQKRCLQPTQHFAFQGYGAWRRARCTMANFFINNDVSNPVVQGVTVSNVTNLSIYQIKKQKLHTKNDYHLQGIPIEWAFIFNNYTISYSNLILVPISLLEDTSEHIDLWIFCASFFQFIAYINEYILHLHIKLAMHI